MRVVLDTNILISALWTPGGLEARTVALAREGKVLACVSDELAREYRDVLSREKFARLRAAADQLLLELQPCLQLVRPLRKVAWSMDEDDNRVLECLQEAAAAYLITGNLRHFPTSWEGSKIVNARGFLLEAFPSLL